MRLRKVLHQKVSFALLQYFVSNQQINFIVYYLTQISIFNSTLTFALFLFVSNFYLSDLIHQIIRAPNHEAKQPK